MMFQRIYEHIDVSTPSVYQIKFKGVLSHDLTFYNLRFRVTVETSDLSNPVMMLTGPIKGQADLLNVLNNLHKHDHAIISVACIEVGADSEQPASA